MTAKKDFTEAFELVHEDGDGFQILRRKHAPDVWLLFKGDELLVAAQNQEAVIDILNRLQNLRTLAKAFNAPAY